MNDRDFNQIHSLVMAGLGGYGRTAYAVVDGVDSIDTIYLASRRVEAIDIGRGPSYTENLSDFITRLTNKRLLTTDVPRRDYTARKLRRNRELVRFLRKRGIVKRLWKRRRRIVKCVEYLMHSPIMEQGQYNNWQPELWQFERKRLGPPAEALEEYERTDEHGTIWRGFAIGL